MTINGIDLDFRLSNARIVGRYTRALQTAMEELGKASRDDAEQMILDGCAIVSRFFDAVFGDGTAAQVVADQEDLLVALDALDAVVAEADRQQAALEARNKKYAVDRTGKRAR